MQLAPEQEIALKEMLTGRISVTICRVVADS